MTTINELSQVDTISAGDQFPIYSTANGTARKVAFSTVSTALLSSVSGELIPQYAAPISGGTTSFNDNSFNTWLVLTPTATLASNTIRLPALANCVMGQEVLVTTTQAITALTINGNGSSVIGAPAGLAAGGFFKLKFESVLDTWYRVG
jgi:hypothetical protein